MAKLRDTVQIAFFGIWILVGILALFSLSKYLSATLPDPTQNPAALGTQQQQQSQQQSPQSQTGQQIPVQPSQQMQQQMQGQSVGQQQQSVQQPQVTQTPIGPQQ